MLAKGFLENQIIFSGYLWANHEISKMEESLLAILSYLCIIKDMEQNIMEVISNGRKKRSIA